MKFNKLGSIATAAVLAGTMGLMPVTALALTGPANYGTSQKIEKTYNYGRTPYAPTDFQFKLEYNKDKTTKVGSNTPETPSLKNPQDSTVSVTAIDANTNDKVYTSYGEVYLSALVDKWNFTAPGMYTFTLSEVNDHNPNVSYDTTTYDVRVDVVWNDNHTQPVVNNYAVFAVTNGTPATTKSANATFTNGSTAASGDLEVSKTVAGTAANTNDYFMYTLELTNESKVSGSYSVVKGDSTVATLNADNGYTATFYLKSGEHVSIAGLPKGVEFKVTEDTHVVNDTQTGVTADDNDYDERNTVNGKTSANGTVATGTLADAGTTVAYTNSKGFAPDTGITSNTLPFAVGGFAVVVAGGALIVSRRRRAGEDF